ncbi:hypothetical protein TNCV_1244911 [Trichonephila clavipes]|nr:hypothetical protein TNCV_1244911 [Trichonephila clavipes]
MDLDNKKKRRSWRLLTGRSYVLHLVLISIITVGEKDMILKYGFFNSDGIIKSIKLSRMRWAGQLVRMSPERTVLKIFNTTQLPLIKDQRDGPKGDEKTAGMRTLPF